MSDEWEEVSLNRRQDGYQIERKEPSGKISAITLSDLNLQSLLPLIQRECARLLESQLTPALKAQGVEPIVAIPVRKFVVGDDLHRSEIFLTLIDKDGNSYRFSFTPAEGARTVGQRLIERADKLTGSAPMTKQ